MVQPNCKVFSTVYITEDASKKFQANLTKYAQETKTKIKFNFSEQVARLKLAIKASVIAQHLLPALNKNIDSDYLYGTFPDMESVPTAPKPPRHRAIQSELDDKDNYEALSDDDDTGYDDSVHDAQAEKMSMALSESRIAGRDFGSDSDSDSDDNDNFQPQEGEFSDTFVLAKNIKSPDDIFLCPPMANIPSTDVLQVIGKDTQTQCTLIDRTVHIFGTSKDAVNTAKERIQNMQSLYKRRRKPAVTFPCFHYRTEDTPAGLYFIDLNQYAKGQHIYILDRALEPPVYVVAPVFKNPETGKFIQPADLLSQTEMPRGETPMYTVEDLEERIRIVTMEQEAAGSYIQAARSLGPPPGEQALWGETSFTTITSAQKPPAVKRTPPGLQASEKQASKGVWGKSTNPPVQPSTVEDFPALTSSPKQAKKPPSKIDPSAEKGLARKVIRINNQKAPPKKKNAWTKPSGPKGQSGQGAPTPAKNTKNNTPKVKPVTTTPSQPFPSAENVWDHDMHKAVEALTEGLTAFRAFHGELQLKATIGRVLWNKMPTAIMGKIWGLYDIADVVVKEHGVVPTFNPVLTQSGELASYIASTFGEPSGRSSHYEVHALTKSFAKEPYKRSIIFIDEGNVGPTRVVQSLEKIADFNHICLGSQWDFSLSLSAVDLGRREAKPYVSFARKLTMSPQTKHISFENISDVLIVKQVLYKQTSKFRLNYPFMAHFSRVEEVPLSEESSGRLEQRFTARVGRGNVWFELEVVNVLTEATLKSNTKTKLGERAPWNVSDILVTPQSKEAKTDPITAQIHELLRLIDICEKCANNLSA